MGCKLLEFARECWIKAETNGALAPCILFGVIHTLAGIAVLAVSIWLYVDSSLYIQNTADSYTYFTAIYILMGAGAIMTIVGFLGCCGALQESPCMLGTFFVFLLVIFAAEVTGGLWAWIHKDGVKDLITIQVTNMVKNYSIQEDSMKQNTLVKTVDAMQHNLQCCGANAPGDWHQSAYNNKGEKDVRDVGIGGQASGDYKVPSTCCKPNVNCEEARNLKNSGEDFEGLYSEGCVPQLKKYLKDHLTIIIGIGIGVGIVQILGLIFSIVLCCAIRNEEAEVFKA
ncbi:CD9 antigen-like isoform X1 [Centruroides sculpturatus]|uniref:CD9 antigen-like isoform X1 n=1 Tax=Centruroides sculpturatus TaxID=218467 RepID=UPI000C6C941B|nr:CD9 antigen-like isoform X1 [Centruroides sculpturatus]